MRADPPAGTGERFQLGFASMTVDQLREMIAGIPGHWPVVVEIITNTEGCLQNRGACTDYYYTLDCIPDGFPQGGPQATVRLNYEPT